MASHQYIITVDKLILYPVCTNGSLGCLAYSGGPLVHCDCCCTSSDDNETIMIPYVGYTPSADDTGSPDTPMCTCRCNHREFNVAEVLKCQVIFVKISNFYSCID